jgi:hypothetical protein
MCLSIMCTSQVLSLSTRKHSHTGKMGENPSLGLLFQMRSSLREAAREGEQRGTARDPFSTWGVTNKNLPQSR